MESTTAVALVHTTRKERLVSERCWPWRRRLRAPRALVVWEYQDNTPYGIARVEWAGGCDVGAGERERYDRMR